MRDRSPIPADWPCPTNLGAIITGFVIKAPVSLGALAACVLAVQRQAARVILYALPMSGELREILGKHIALR